MPPLAFLVGADNQAAGEMAARHLVGLGHRRIGLIFPPTQDNDRARGRLTGARAVLGAAVIAVPESWIVEAPYSLSEAKEAVLDLLRGPDVPTALLCGNDVLAVGAIYAAQRCGIAVPEALSVIGVGDFKGSREMEPTLTTIRLPARRIGRLAGQQMARAIVQPGGDTVRESCDIDLMPGATCVRVS